jgi:hypothetical protein
MTAVSPPHQDLAGWAQALGFSLEALELNRKGQLAPGQLGWFGFDLIRAVFLPIVLVAAAAGAFLAVKSWSRWPACLGLLALATFFVNQGMGRIRDRLHPQILSVEGKPEFSGGYRHSVVMRIGSQDFTVPEDVRYGPGEPLISPDRTYRAYYLSSTGRQLTIEPVDQKPEVQKP